LLGRLIVRSHKPELSLYEKGASIVIWEIGLNMRVWSTKVDMIWLDAKAWSV